MKVFSRESVKDLNALPRSAEVAISQQLSPEIKRKIALFNPDDVVKSNPELTAIQLQRGEAKVVSLVALKLTLKVQNLFGTEMVGDVWSALIEPIDEHLYRRFLPTAIGQAGRGVRYDAREALRRALETFSNATKPPKNTELLFQFYYDKEGEKRLVPPWVSSLEELRRRQIRANRHNDAVRASSWPFDQPLFQFSDFKLFGRPINEFNLWGKGRLVNVPDFPEKDEWAEKNEKTIRDVYEKDFLPILDSLWKAAFTYGYAKTEMEAKGYRLNVIGTTQIGDRSAASYIGVAKGDYKSYTRLGTLSGLEELDDEALADEALAPLR